jgi:hypothetical protein
MAYNTAEMKIENGGMDDIEEIFRLYAIASAYNQSPFQGK